MKLMNREKLKILTALAFIAFIAVVGYGSLKKVIIKAESGSCTITGVNVGIFASCENKDVIIGGAGTVVLADMYPVIQPNNPGAGNLCSDAYSNGSCDTKRHFNKLTIEDGAILTHSKVTVDDMSQDWNHNGSLLDEASSYARPNKVDIEVEGNIILSGGGKIDVTGKGYPGGRTGKTSDINSCSWNGKDYLGEDGYGPGPGLKDGKIREAIASGAGFGGKGGVGRNNLSGGNPYSNIGDYPYSSLEWGSGGGSGYSHTWQGGPFGEQNNQACANGGAGGGRIHLKAKDIEIKDNNSIIKANGADYEEYYTNSLHTWGGGGSGGAIWLEAGNDISTPEDGLEVSVEGGGDLNSKVMWADNGEIRSNIKQTNISANGGNGGGGGAGGRIVLASSQTTPGTPGSGGTTTYTTNKRKIKVQVSWRDPSNPNPVELSTILIGLTKQVTAPIPGTDPTTGGLPAQYFPKNANIRVYTANGVGNICVRKQTLVGYCFNSGLRGDIVDAVADKVGDKEYLYVNLYSDSVWSGIKQEFYRFNRLDLTQKEKIEALSNKDTKQIAVSSEHIYMMNFSDEKLCRYNKTAPYTLTGCKEKWDFPPISGFGFTRGLDFDNKNKLLYVVEATGNNGFIAQIDIDQNWKIIKIIKKVDSISGDKYASARSVATDGNNVYTANTGWFCKWDNNLAQKQCPENSNFNYQMDLAIDTHNVYMQAAYNFVAKVSKISLAVDGEKITDSNTAIAAWKDQ